MREFQCEAILFDLDGVLVDSTKTAIAIWTAWSEKNGIPPAKTLDIIHGRRTTEAVKILTPHLDAESEAAKLESGITHPKGGTIAIAGAATLLRSLPDDRWCVVTSGLRDFAKLRLRGGGLPIPRILVCAEDVVNGKPHPEPYLKGAQLLAADPAKCIVVEDAPNGIRAGRAAGMKVIGLSTTYPASELKEANVVVATLEDLTANSANGQLTIHTKN